VPASKSVTQRYFTLALLARRQLRVDHPLDAEDTRLFRAALGTCGLAVETGDDHLVLTPVAEPPRTGEIFCGNGGTMFRFLLAALTALPGRWTLDGVPRLRQRPVGPLIAALRGLGAVIECYGQEGFAPLSVHGGTLAGGSTKLDAGSSSQYLSALLMAGLTAPAPVTIEVEALTSEPYVDITLQAIARFGGRVERPAERCYRVYPAPQLGCDRVVVEGDYSTACYPAAAAALTGGAVTLRGLVADSLQGDRVFFALLERMGATVAWHGGEVEVCGGGLSGLEADLSAMPDQVPTLAALAPFAQGVTRICNVPHLRIKESDRLRAMAVELTKMGAPVVEEAAALEVQGAWAAGPPPAGPVVVDPHGDHRIAMSCALVGLRRPGVAVADPQVVEKSYPGFWSDLERLLEPAPRHHDLASR
jgi:3-phosphoshikimate 1-carboxyvinyltransferase